MKRLILLLLLLPLNLWSANIYVDGGTVETGATWDGVNGHSYSCAHGTGTGYSTVQAAITGMTGGDDIYIRGGTYQEYNITIPVAKSGTSGDWSSLRSYPGEWAIIDGQRLCTGNTRGLIENTDGFVHSGATSSYARYWLFERLELTGGGTTDAGETTAAGIWWAGGPFTVRYCYIHDNLSPDATGNPAGIGGPAWDTPTIEFNFFDHNGSAQHGQGEDAGGGNTCAGIAPEGQWDYTSPNFDYGWTTKNETYRYNRIQAYGDTGIRTKASNRLTATRDGSDLSKNGNGPKIHHNIIQGAGYGGIFYQTDFAQIYSNIIVMDYHDDANWGVATRRIRSEGVDQLYPCIWNNTIIGSGGSGIFADFDAKYGQWVAAYYVNNIIDGNTPGIYTRDIAYAHRDEQPTYPYFHGETWPTSFTGVSDIKIDRNYFYRSNSTDSVILLGLVAGTDDEYTASRFESVYSVDLFQNAYNAGDLLYVGTTGADKYRTRSAHILEGSDTIGNAGLNSAHPYLAGVTVPAYVGATNPSDDSWVAGVLALDATYMASATDGSDPSWIEGSTPTPAPPTLSFYLTNPSGSGTAQGSPHNSLGGYRSTTQVSASAMKNLFDDVTVAESIVGDTEYRFLDVYNSGDSSATKVQVFVSSDTSSSGTEITLGYNSANQPHEDSWDGEDVANEDTAPASPSLTFGTYTRASPLHLGTIPAGRSVRICVKRTVTAGVPWTARDVGTIAVRYLGD